MVEDRRVRQSKCPHRPCGSCSFQPSPHFVCSLQLFDIPDKSFAAGLLYISFLQPLEITSRDVCAAHVHLAVYVMFVSQISIMRRRISGLHMHLAIGLSILTHSDVDVGSDDRKFSTWRLLNGWTTVGMVIVMQRPHRDLRYCTIFTSTVSPFQEFNPRCWLTATNRRV